jgi:predicted  nucleic acid-binding Zn ribbon protein
MHSLSIKFKKSIDENELWHLFYNLLAYLRHSGQLVGRDMNPFVLNGKMSASIVTATEDALDEKNQNSYVKKGIESLEKLCGYQLQTKFCGYGENQKQSVCMCKKHKHLLLRFSDEYSPVQCGSCYKSIPLYKLKKIRDDGYEPITSWMSNSLACVLLDINCRVGEKWAIKQQSNPHTELGKEGIAVTKLIAEKNGIPCYYYLHNYAKHSVKKDNERTCPNCGHEWKLAQEIHQWVWFKCDRCFLMSGKTTNS